MKKHVRAQIHHRQLTHQSACNRQNGDSCQSQGTDDDCECSYVCADDNYEGHKKGSEVAECHSGGLPSATRLRVCSCIDISVCLDSTCNGSQLSPTSPLGYGELCMCVMSRWHASGRRPLPLQVTPLTSHLFPVGGETEEG